MKIAGAKCVKYLARVLRLGSLIRITAIVVLHRALGSNENVRFLRSLHVQQFVQVVGMASIHCRLEAMQLEWQSILFSVRAASPLRCVLPILICVGHHAVIAQRSRYVIVDVNEPLVRHSPAESNQSLRDCMPFLL